MEQVVEKLRKVWEIVSVAEELDGNRLYLLVGSYWIEVRRASMETAEPVSVTRWRTDYGRWTGHHRGEYDPVLNRIDTDLFDRAAARNAEGHLSAMRVHARFYRSERAILDQAEREMRAAGGRDPDRR